MARRSSQRSRQRIIHQPSTVPSGVVSPIRPLQPLAVPADQFEPLTDRRTFHPDHPFQPAPSITPADRRLVPNRYNPARISFANPTRVLTCLRRAIRRQVLFSRGVGGQRGRKRRPHRTPHSKIGC